MMRTLFRATVMFCVLGTTAWAMVEYGAASAVRPIATHAIELADRLIGRPGAGAVLTPPQFVNIVPQNTPQLQLAVDSKTDSTRGFMDRSQAQPTLPPRELAVREEDLISPLTRLEQLSSSDVAASPWGASGQMHRVCCEIPLPHAQGVTRHFEAVATSRDEASSLVLAEIRAWQMERESLATR